MPWPCEMARSYDLGIPFVVHHPGAHMGAGEVAGIKRIAEGINVVLQEPNGPRLLLETCAGQGRPWGIPLNSWRPFWSRLNKRIASASASIPAMFFAAGYDIRTETAYRPHHGRLSQNSGAEQAPGDSPKRRPNGSWVPRWTATITSEKGKSGLKDFL